MSGKEGKRSKTMKEGGFRVSTTTEPEASCAGGSNTPSKVQPITVMTKRKTELACNAFRLSLVFPIILHEGKKEKEKKKKKKREDNAHIRYLVKP